MRAGADVIVVGGGIIGCAVAHEIARRGGRVRLFEARSIGAGATHASAGILAPYIEGHERGPFFDLALRSLTLYDAFIRAVVDDSGADVDYRRCGSLEIAVDPTHAHHLRASADANAGAGLEWLTPERARRLEPALPPAIEGALRSPMHGYVAVPALTEALVWAALRHGAELETGRHIRAIDADGDRLRVVADDGASWTAPTVIVAAGSWTSQLERAEPAARSVRPVRGQTIRLAWIGSPISHVIWGKDCYVVPWKDGTVLVGATVEDVGYDERTTAAGVRDLLDAACDLLPEAWGATFLEARAGLRPATSDGLPLIGRSPQINGLVYATGHFRNGVLLAPLTAAVVADLVLDDREDPALMLTGPGRLP
ncbi:MAG TPA: glycine oxidase ThiO [Vicinamibacterales bacterium]|jgi:glycine oxidase